MLCQRRRCSIILRSQASLATKCWPFSRPPVLMLGSACVSSFWTRDNSGFEPTFARLLSNVVDIGYLARQAGIFRVPPGFHLSLARATPAGPENHITIQTGDVVTFGFRSDSDSEIGDASSLGSQVVSTPDPDDSTADSHAAGSDVAPDTGTDRSSSRSADRRSRSRSRAPGAEPSDSLRPRQGRPTMWRLVFSLACGTCRCKLA